MGLCWGRWAAGWSMRGAVLVWLYCLDSSKGTCWWCWEKSRWWKFSSWTGEVCSTGLSRLPHWRLIGGLYVHIGKKQNNNKWLLQTLSTLYEGIWSEIVLETIWHAWCKTILQNNSKQQSWKERQGWEFTFSWGALGRCRALQGTSSGLRGLLVAAYLLLFPMVALVTSCRRVTLWERKSYSGGTCMLPLIVLTLQRKKNTNNKNANCHVNNHDYAAVLITVSINWACTNDKWSLWVENKTNINLFKRTLYVRFTKISRILTQIGSKKKADNRITDTICTLFWLD